MPRKSIQNFERLSPILLAISCFVLSSSSVAGQANDLPMTIRIFLMESESQQWESQVHGTAVQLNLSFVENEAIVEVPAGAITIGIICNASFPVAWTAQFSEKNPHTVSFVRRSNFRFTKDPLDHSSFNYFAISTVVRLDNFLTGRYVCQSSRNKSLTYSVYLYWKGNPENVFVNFKNNITLSKSDISNPNKIILPCIVSTPNATVVLYKFSAQGRIRLVRNDSIIYDPRVGFTLLNLVNVSGYYRCFTTQTNWDIDYVGVIVPSLNTTKNSSTNATETTLKSNPSISVDAKRQMAVCCSGLGGTKSPKMFNILCPDPTTCDYMKRISNMEHWFHGVQSRQTRKNDCTSFKLTPYFNTGVIRCVGPDFDIQMDYIFPASELLRFHLSKSRSSSKLRINTVWTTWEEIIPEDMMIIDEAPTGPYMPKIMTNQSKVIYDGEHLSLICLSSPYYFAGGIQWALKFKNGTVIFHSNQRGLSLGISSGPRNLLHLDDGHYDFIELIAHKDLSAVVCLAPVWNSSLWVHKIFHLYINESKSAQVELVQQDKLSWYLNETEKILQCNGVGSPLPTFTWYRDEESLETRPNIEITQNVTSNGSEVQSMLKIHRVSHRSGGVYKCVANNSAGLEFQTITVQVLEKSSWHHATAITVGVLSALGLLTAIGFFIWKIKTGQRDINSLRDGETHSGFENGEDGVDVNIHNKIYDPSTLNADLLD